MLAQNRPFLAIFPNSVLIAQQIVLASQSVQAYLSWTVSNIPPPPSVRRNRFNNCAATWGLSAEPLTTFVTIFPWTVATNDNTQCYKQTLTIITTSRASCQLSVSNSIYFTKPVISHCAVSVSSDLKALYKSVIIIIIIRASLSARPRRSRVQLWARRLVGTCRSTKRIFKN